MKITTEGLFLNTVLVIFKQLGTPSSSLFHVPRRLFPQPVKLKHPSPFVVPWTNNLCASLFMCQRLYICTAFSWFGVFLWGRIAGTGWMPDNKASCQSALCALSLTFLPAMLSSSSCSPSHQSAKHMKKASSNAGGQAEGSARSQAAEVSPLVYTLLKCSQAALPLTHASLVSVSFSFLLVLPLQVLQDELQLLLVLALTLAVGRVLLRLTAAMLLTAVWRRGSTTVNSEAG